MTDLSPTERTLRDALSDAEAILEGGSEGYDPLPIANTMREAAQRARVVLAQFPQDDDPARVRDAYAFPQPPASARSSGSIPSISASTLGVHPVEAEFAEFLEVTDPDPPAGRQHNPFPLDPSPPPPAFRLHTVLHPEDWLK